MNVLPLTGNMPGPGGEEFAELDEGADDEDVDGDGAVGRREGEDGLEGRAVDQAVDRVLGVDAYVREGELQGQGDVLRGVREGAVEVEEDGGESGCSHRRGSASRRGVREMP